MNEIALKKDDFMNMYNKSHRLGAAVFVVSNLMDEREELKTKVKSLSLQIISMSISLKDTNFLDARKLILDIEKLSLELMSIVDIASITGLISKMNGSILKEEFQSFITELSNFSLKSESNKNTSIERIFNEPLPIKDENHFVLNMNDALNNKKINESKKSIKNNNGSKRKDLRKNNILDFIKGHNNVNIKDITPNIVGCSEKTVQRELINLIKEGKIVKNGERRWTKYSLAFIS